MNAISPLTRSARVETQAGNYAVRRDAEGYVSVDIVNIWAQTRHVLTLAEARELAAVLRDVVA